MIEFKPKRVLILGGTGTLGNATVEGLLQQNIDSEIVVLSRDEHKHVLMSRKYPKLSFMIGDIKEPMSLIRAMKGVDVCFHFAALKHVDIMELNPAECMKTNLFASENIALACMSSGVKNVVFSSTDKAVDPINTYGLCKALSEKTFFDYNKRQTNTRFSVYRWGNVIGSQGSAIHFFKKTLLEEKKVYLTDINMTRFWIPIEWAVNYMLRTIPFARPNVAMVPPLMKAARLTEIVKALAELLNIETYETKIVGLRPGEKLHEAIESQHSSNYLTSETAEQYHLSELKEMLRGFI